MMLIVAGTSACSSPVTVTVYRDPVPTSTSVTQAVGSTSPSSPAGAEASESTRVTAAASNLLGGSLAASTLRTPPPTVLQIPAISLDTEIDSISSSFDGDQWDWLVPLDLAAHHLGTANPGEPGNIVISGHVSTQSGSGVFANLSQLEVGDTIALRSDNGIFTYQVVSATVVPEEDTSVLYQVPYEQLTLITCVADGAFRDRVVIRAERI